jgi:integrase
VFSPRELERLVTVTQQEPYWQARIGLGLVGCRRKEMFEVVKSNVHMDEDTPYILLAARKADAHGWAWRPKNHRLRYIALPGYIVCGNTQLPLREAIAECIRRTPAGQPYIILEPKVYRRMMERKHQGSLSLDHTNDPFGNFQRAFNTVQRRAGIVPVHKFHDLRRTFGTQAVERLGLDAGTKALGNSSVEVTRRHYHVSEKLKLVQTLNERTPQFYEA